MELRFAWQRPDAVQRQVLRRAPACAPAASCWASPSAPTGGGD